MLGVILGDLAALRYLRNKDEFYALLIGRCATVSEVRFRKLRKKSVWAFND